MKIHLFIVTALFFTLMQSHRNVSINLMKIKDVSFTCKVTILLSAMISHPLWYWWNIIWYVHLCTCHISTAHHLQSAPPPLHPPICNIFQFVASRNKVGRMASFSYRFCDNMNGNIAWTCQCIILPAVSQLHNLYNQSLESGLKFLLCKQMKLGAQIHRLTADRQEVTEPCF